MEIFLTIKFANSVYMLLLQLPRRPWRIGDTVSAICCCLAEERDFEYTRKVEMA